MLKWFPKLLNDIYLSEEYYGENVLHMGCVAEDASLVKWLLDIGADIHRYQTTRYRTSFVLYLIKEMLWKLLLL